MHSMHVGANAAFSLLCCVLPMLIVTLQVALLNAC